MFDMDHEPDLLYKTLYTLQAFGGHMTQTRPKNPGTLVSINEACRFLGIGRTTFLKIRAKGEIPEIRITDDCVRFHQEDLNAYVQKRRIYTPNVL